MNDSLASSGLIVVDKPAGMTSHDVVGRLRRIMKTRKVGHAGTLDPMATGVLVCGIERGTKFLAHMVAATKSYEATIKLGAATTTDDFEGEIISSSDTIVSEQEITEALSHFRGEIMQKPAAVSSIKINGKRAHELVREGHEVDIPARPVTIFDLTHTIRGMEIDIAVTCSSGTYIRSIARDLGEMLGVGGHLIALRRTALGPYREGDALTLEQLEASPQLSLGLDEALTRMYPVLEVSSEDALALSMGKWLEPRGLKGTHAAVGPDGKAVALIKESKTRLSTVFVARPSTL